MEQNMTALVSLFARAYHQKSKDIKIFDDPLSTKLITKKDMVLISLLEPYLLILFSSIYKNNFLPSLKNQTKIDLLNLKLQYLRTYLDNLHEATNPL